jgi:hypothetical protein
MECDWEGKSFSFKQQGQQITLQGVVSPQQGQLTELSVEQLHKWLSGNEVWALALLDHLPETTKEDNPENNHSPDLQAILTEFADVFDEPKTATTA